MLETPCHTAGPRYLEFSDAVAAVVHRSAVGNPKAVRPGERK